jgi:hypothetical protein
LFFLRVNDLKQKGHSIFTEFLEYTFFGVFPILDNGEICARIITSLDIFRRPRSWRKYSLNTLLVY